MRSPASFPRVSSSLQANDADQDAVGGCDQCRLYALPFEVVWHLAYTEIRPERHWTGVHHLLDWSRGISRQRVGVNDSQNDAIGVNDDERVTLVSAHAIPHVANALVKSARRNVARRNIRHTRSVGISA